MAEHTRNIFDGGVIGKQQGGERVADNVACHRLVDLGVTLDDMKVLVQFLIADLRYLEIVLLQHLHCRRKNRGIESCTRLHTAAINKVGVAYLIRHRLKVEDLGVAVCKAGVSLEHEKVAGMLFIVRQVFKFTDTKELFFTQRSAFLALATTELALFCVC